MPKTNNIFQKVNQNEKIQNSLKNIKKIIHSITNRVNSQGSTNNVSTSNNNKRYSSPIVIPLLFPLILSLLIGIISLVSNWLLIFITYLLLYPFFDFLEKNKFYKKYKNFIKNKKSLLTK